MSDDIKDLTKTIKELTAEIKRLTKRVAILEEGNGWDGWKPKKRTKICPHCQGTGKVRDGYNPYHNPYPYYSNCVN